MLQVLEARGSMLESNLESFSGKRSFKIRVRLSAFLLRCLKHKAARLGKVWLMLHVVSLCGFGGEFLGVGA